MSAAGAESRKAAQAFGQLRSAVAALTAELAAVRSRATDAERALADHLGPAGVGDADALDPRALQDALARADDLERRNAELQRRLDVAIARTRQMLERVRFLRQQHEERR